jgi:hypothetical protein
MNSTGAGSGTTANIQNHAIRSTLRQRLLAGTAILALLAAGSGYTVHA